MEVTAISCLLERVVRGSCPYSSSFVSEGNIWIAMDVSVITV